MSLDIEALYVAYHRPLRGFIAKRMDGYDDAAIEDVAADVWERVVRAAPSFRSGRGHPKHWLYRIAQNLLIDRYRERGRPVTIVRLGDYKPYVEHVGTSDHLGRIDAQRAVQYAIVHFRTGSNARHPSTKQLAVLRASYFEGGTDAEVGMRLGMTEEGVKHLRYRALANLRRALEAA